MNMKLDREGLIAKLEKVYEGCVHCFAIAKAMSLSKHEKISTKELAARLKLQMKTCGGCADKTRELLLELEKK